MDETPEEALKTHWRELRAIFPGGGPAQKKTDMQKIEIVVKPKGD